ncbi:ATP-dependent DNA ligase domain protein [Oesophagostomum dentatum]|uniref:ATP-dependent DNA ligase domain protein n=1 Tax=Oesophagostomum dentatum TaxID=61180 RepID=A0A0B1TFG6_OESDE|nr:ATP-dependent DNA ligase domain protein [Oesophagostomum dentatum]
MRNRKKIHAAQGARMASAMRVNERPKIALDLQYMFKEKHRVQSELGNQMQYVISENLDSRTPLHLSFVNFPNTEDSQKWLEKSVGFYGGLYTHQTILPDFTHKGVKETFPDEEVVYISRHARDVLDGPLNVGAIALCVSMDTAREALGAARRGRMRVVRLPIKKYVKWQQGPMYLPFPNIMRIFRHVHESGGDWETALLSNISKRHLITPEEKEAQAQLEKTNRRKIRQREKNELIKTIFVCLLVAKESGISQSFLLMLADTLKFADLCVLLSKLRDTKGANASVIRRKLFEKFAASCAEKCENGEDPDAAFHPDAKKVCEVLAAEVSSRIAPEDFEHLSIAEINEKLDHMSESSDTEDLQYLFKNCSQDELFWLFSMMIKNVESTIGVATNIILSWLGPQAVARWNTARDLTEVAAAGSDAEPRLGANFRPMLLARLPKEGWWEVIRENCGDEFFVETKYDGEHVLLHKIAGDQYKWYTRNGKDFTNDYGGSSKLKDLLSGRIHPFFRKNVTDCILDCELMLWDKKLKKLCRRQFKSQNSEHRSHSFRHIDPLDHVQLAVVVFDLLYLNGKSIMNAPLHQRIRALEAGVLKDNKHIETIAIAPRKTVSAKEEVEELFAKALGAGEEGIVVKRKDVTYQPGTRMTKNGWFKMKAYLGDNEMDVALVAVDKGKDERVTYQLAVRDGDKYQTITHCASGLGRIDRDYIYDLSAKAEGPLLKEPPPELRGWNIIDPKGGFIRKEHWIVVEMTAAGVRDGKFIDPVMRRIRYDKDIEEVDTLQMFKDYEKMLQNSKLSDKSPTKVTPRKITKRMIVEGSAVPEVDAKQIHTDSPLVGRTICVLYGTDERLRKRLMEILKIYGANVVANPGDVIILLHYNMGIPRIYLFFSGRHEFGRSYNGQASEDKSSSTSWRDDSFAIEMGAEAIKKQQLECEAGPHVSSLNAPVSTTNSQIFFGWPPCDTWTPDEVLNEVDGGFTLE